MRIYLRELNDHETELDFDQTEAWVKASVERVDEKGEETLPRKKGERTIKVHLSLRKVDEVAVLNGDLRTNIHLLCSRCAKSFGLPIDINFSSLFCQDAAMAGIGHLETQHGELKPAGQNKGFARHAHDENSAENGQDLDITYLSQDFIELGDVLSEQLRLQIPFQPLCEEDCLGMCAQCGADLNAGRCACSKIIKQTPFSVLRNLKL